MGHYLILKSNFVPNRICELKGKFMLQGVGIDQNVPTCHSDIFARVASKIVPRVALGKKFGGIQNQSVAPDLHPVASPDGENGPTSILDQRPALDQALKNI